MHDTAKFFEFSRSISVSIALDTDIAVSSFVKRYKQFQLKQILFVTVAKVTFEAF
jgi:hypothetical protein